MNESLDNPNIRFSNVLKALKAKGYSQRDVLDEMDLDNFNIDEVYISQLKSGHRKNIPEEIIEALHTRFLVNPEYLRMESNRMFEFPEKRIDRFLSIVDDLDLVTDGQLEHLHLTIDKNIIDYLIEQFKASESIEETGLTTIEEAKRKLLERYSGEPNPKEYILIERNRFFKVAEDYVKHREMIQDVFDHTIWEDSLPPNKDNPNQNDI